VNLDIATGVPKNRAGQNQLNGAKRLENRMYAEEISQVIGGSDVGDFYKL
jgi:hypothetical protein